MTPTKFFHHLSNESTQNLASIRQNIIVSGNLIAFYRPKKGSLGSRKKLFWIGWNRYDLSLGAENFCENSSMTDLKSKMTLRLNYGE